MSTSRATHLRGGYLLRNPLLWAYLSATDGLLRIRPSFRRDAAHADARTPPRRVLLAVGGHLGDAIIAARAIDVVHTTFSEAEIGLLTPSWSKIVNERDSRVRWSHTVDHWRTNRADVSVGAKLLRYRNSAAAAAREIKAVGYDIAFDLYPYYPNMAGVLWRAGIPERVGFSTGGHGPLYTSTLSWVDDRCHIGEKQLRLIQARYPQAAGASGSSRFLPRPGDEASREAGRILGSSGVRGAYTVLHVGSGLAERCWPIASWRLLAEQLTASTTVVLTGAGAKEEEAAAAVSDGLSRCVDLAGRLNWTSRESVVHGASLVVAGETSVGHLAAAHGVPVVSIYSGIVDWREWRPVGPSGSPVTVLTDAVPCAPCYRPNGCATMACVRGVSVERVLSAIDELTRPPR